MPGYRLYFLDKHGHITGVLELDCPDDAQAVAAAESHHAGEAMELWERGRIVHEFPARQDA
jgi:hypothetical protein